MVFKDHHSMTNNVATVIQDFLDRMAADLTARGEESFTPVQVFGGTVLNYAVGGMNIEQVKTALDYDPLQGNLAAVPRRWRIRRKLRATTPLRTSA